MAPSKIRRALGAVKDQTSISLAKVGSSASLADLDVAIVKATRHEEQPAEEKYIREILSLTCYSRAFISACVNTLSRRLSKTRNWTVALKTLILVQRLLSDGDPAYEQEIFFSTRRGTRFLNLSDFRDSSSDTGAWDYSAFVRTYALYLDERLEYRMQSRRGRRSAFTYEDEDDDVAAAAAAAAGVVPQPPPPAVKATPVREMKTEQVFSRANHLQQLLDRFLACRPTGAAKTNRVVIVALYPSVKESFQIYYELTEAMGILIDRFMDMEVSDCVKVLDIFSRVGKQLEDLDMLYGWCKAVGIARSSEYPEVEKITPKKLEVMDEFIRDKSALTAQSNSAPRIMMKPEEEEEEKDTTITINKKEEEEEEEALVEQEDMNAIKALPAPEDCAKKTVQEEGDLLNLGEGGLTAEEHADKLALALFDGAGPTAPPTQAGPGWEAFTETQDWETALVESASGMARQKTELAGGFDVLMLDGMYKRGAEAMAMAGPGFGVSGSASSVALGSAGRPAMLALPASAASKEGEVGGDPFAASLGVAPPAYVQMSEMERKQRMLVEEQMMWQQYARDGMQGQLGMGRINQHTPTTTATSHGGGAYNMGGGYARTY